MITFAIFFLMPRLAGATPETLAARYVGKSPTGSTVAEAAKSLGFTEPIHVQYWHWAKAIFTGTSYDIGPTTEVCHAPCLGYSFRDHSPVWPQLKERIPVTFSLAIGAAVIWLVFGIAVGVLSALRRGTFFDRLAMTVALAGVSMPIFWTGLICLSVFSYQLGWTPPGGSFTPFTQDPLKWAGDLFLPWVTLALLFSAQYARLTRAGMLETMGEDYIRTARAKGLPERTVVVKHGLRAALTPIVTIFGLDFGLLIGGAILTERAFSLNGLGLMAVTAINNNDLPKVLGVVLVASTFVAVSNLIVDLLYAVVDPRVRTR